MAERIVSPGVFTRERDLSFLPQAIGEIGAAIIGPTKQGPAFTPTQVTLKRCLVAWMQDSIHLTP